MKKLLLAAVALFATLALADDKKPADDTKPAAGDKTIADIAMADDNFSTLVTAVKAAGLADVLKGTDELTVFAPTNKAFEAVGKDALADLLKDKEKLTAVLKAHIVKGKVLSGDVAKLDGKEVETLDGSKFKITVKDKDVMIGNAKVVKADIAAKNGVIHVIDAVLMPTKKAEK